MRRLKTLARLTVTALLLAAVFQIQAPAAHSSECTDGQKKNVFLEYCGCSGRSTLKDQYLCIGGEWVYQDTVCGGPFCND